LNLPKQIVLSDSEVENFINQNDFGKVAEYLFHSQLNSWKLLRENYNALKNIRTKSFWFDGFKIKVQFNPERIKSTTAKVDAESVADRICFLCVDNLPEEQKGIPILDKYFLLCNPYPVFPKHFTIVSFLHESQRINENIEDLLELSKLLSPVNTLVYNGPACGASAPDHLHFQAGTKLFMPIEDDIQQMKNNYGNIIRENNEITVSFIDDGLRRLIFIESADRFEISSIFKIIFNEFKILSGNSTEPMMNLICQYDKEFGWNLIVFLRGKHRPECYFADDTKRILVSPAAIDLGGVVITPGERDFSRIDKETLTQIMSEVSLDKEIFSALAEKVTLAFR
jgi:hypothetical protein